MMRMACRPWPMRNGILKSVGVMRLLATTAATSKPSPLCQAEGSQQTAPYAPTLFKDLHVASHIHTKLHRVSQTINSPTPMQAAAIKTILDPARPDVLVQSPAGSGKTLAYLLPALSIVDSKKGLQVVIVVPTQPLARQIRTVSLRLIGNHSTRLKTVTEHYEQAARKLGKEPPHVLIGTAHCVAELVKAGNVDMANVRLVVLDEVGTLYSRHLAPLTDTIVGKHRPWKNGSGRQLVSVGAVIGPRVMEILHKHSPTLQLVVGGARPDEPNTVVDSLPPHLSHRHVAVAKGSLQGGEEKAALLLRIATAMQPEGPLLVFFRCKDDVVAVSEALSRRHVYHEAIYNGALRTRTNDMLTRLCIGVGVPRALRFVLATEVMALGIDCSPLAGVVNMAPPKDLASYAQRAGRVGRLQATMLCEADNDVYSDQSAGSDVYSDQSADMAQMKWKSGTVVTVLEEGSEARAQLDQWVTTLGANLGSLELGESQDVDVTMTGVAQTSTDWLPES